MFLGCPLFHLPCILHSSTLNCGPPCLILFPSQDSKHKHRHILPKQININIYIFYLNKFACLFDTYNLMSDCSNSLYFYLNELGVPLTHLLDLCPSKHSWPFVRWIRLIEIFTCIWVPFLSLIFLVKLCVSSLFDINSASVIAFFNTNCAIRHPVFMAITWRCSKVLASLS